MLTIQLTVIKRTGAQEQQVLELIGVAVIEHLAEQAIGHSVTGTARELVEHLVLVNNCDIQAVDGAMQVGHTLGLLVEHLIGQDKQLGSLHSVKVLVGHLLKARNLLQGLGGIKCHIDSIARRTREVRITRAGSVIIGLERHHHGRIGVVDEPHLGR